MYACTWICDWTRGLISEKSDLIFTPCTWGETHKRKKTTVCEGQTQHIHNCDIVIYTQQPTVCVTKNPLLNKCTHHLWVEIRFTQKTWMFPQEACYEKKGTLDHMGLWTLWGKPVLTLRHHEEISTCWTRQRPYYRQRNYIFLLPNILFFSFLFPLHPAFPIGLILSTTFDRIIHKRKILLHYDLPSENKAASYTHFHFI